MTTDTTTTTTATATDSANSAWQTLLQQADDALSKELLCVQRRYHGQVLPAEQDGTVRVRCFMSLSDPDLAPELKGESEVLVAFPEKYPAEPVRLDLRSWEHRMTSAQFAAVEAAVHQRAEELRGTYSIRKLLTWLDNNLRRLLHDCAPVVEAPSVEEEEEEPKKEAEVGEEAAAAPRSQKACRYLLRGQCKGGDKCKFSHEKAKELRKKKEKKLKQREDAKDATQRAASPVETASAADNTRKTTADDDQTKPATKTKKPKKKNVNKPKAGVACKFYAKGSCRDGENCKFVHETISDKLQLKATGITIAVINEAPASAPLERPLSPTVEPQQLPEPPQEKPEDWTADQQRALDAALKKYPATMEKRERWVAIASEVDGKTLNDCIDRFKLVSARVQSGEPIPIALSVVTVTPGSPMAALSHPACLASPIRTREKGADPKEQEEQLHAKIIPEDKRVAIETDPQVRGTEIRLEELFLYQIGTLVPHSIVCQVQCANCPLKFDATLSLDRDRHSVQKWCPRCSVKHVLALRPVFTHAQSSVLAYVDTENCGVADVLPSDVLASCLECGREALLEKIVPGRRTEQTCFSCHTKLAVMTKRVAVSVVGEGHPQQQLAGGASTTTNGKTGGKRSVQTFVPGQPLPRNGACDHYKHSHRWFRFQCCGKAFACDVCHDSSDCDQANTGKIASKIICGFCSKEQASAMKECSCGNEMGRLANKSRHWEGGQGCRDPTKMAANDRQKFRGQNKTESQKYKRVGVEGKLRANRD